MMAFVKLQLYKCLSITCDKKVLSNMKVFVKLQPCKSFGIIYNKKGFTKYDSFCKIASSVESRVPV
jgi:hypothetical protein